MKNHQISTQNQELKKGVQLKMAFMEENLFEESEKVDNVVNIQTPKKRGRKSKAELEAQQAKPTSTGARKVLNVVEIENLADEIKAEFNITPDNPPASSAKTRKRGRKSKKSRALSEEKAIRHVIKKSVVERIKEFVQICPKVPNQFVYYVGFPNESEREIFALDKNLTFAKLVIWDGEANFAFTINDIEVFEVENIIPNESKIVKGEQEWLLHKYTSTPEFLDIVENQLKNVIKDTELKPDFDEMQKLHNQILTSHTTQYETLTHYQEIMDKIFEKNIKIYNEKRQDFQECQVAIEKIKLFLTTLKN